MAVVSKRMQFAELVQNVSVYTATLNLGNAATGSGTFTSSDVTVPGVALGDVVIGVSLEVDTVDAAVVGAVTAANTVTVTLLNNTAGAVDLASTTVRIVVLRLGQNVSFV
jgi:hypothetical protein